MEVLTGIILLVFGILQIVLFFKIWGMTNDVRDLKERYFNLNPLKQKNISFANDTPFKENDLVVNLKNGKQMRVKEITQEGKYSCYTNNGVIYEGDFTVEEIQLFK